MPLCGAGCKLPGGEPVEARVWASRVIVETPGFDDLARLLQASEQVLVQAFIAKTADKALCKAILHRLARRDVMPVDPALLLPFQDGVRGQLRAVVADNEAGIAAQLRDLVEFAGNANAGERDIGDEAYAFPVEIVDHRQDAKAPPIGERIRRKVQRPALIDPLRDRHRRPRSQSSLAAAALANGQALLFVEPIELLAVQRHPFPAKQQMQTPVAEAPALACKLAKALSDRLVASAFCLITIGLRRKPEQRTSARLRIALLLDRPVHGASPCSGRWKFFPRSSFSVATSSMDSA